MDENTNPYGYESIPPAPEPEALMPPAPIAPPTAAAPPPYGYGQYAYYPPPPQPATQAPVPEKPKRRAGLVIFSIFMALAVVVGVFVGIGAWRFMRGREPGAPANDDSRLTLADTPTQPAAPAPDGALTPVQVHDKLKDSNVSVQLYSGRGVDRMTGEGSGVILHEDSKDTFTYILTCAHVINKNDRVSVELADGRAFDATIIGFDNRTDVGLLSIRATGLHGAEFGDSDKLQVGEAVYAIGNPGGVEFKGSFTGGMVSAIERPITSSYKMQTIQHTAPINPGNSGGALVNAFGQVIGMNSQKIVDTQYEGMGFAIPSKVVQEIVNSLIANNGYVPGRPKLGIKYLPVSRSQRGMLVARINSLPSGSLIIAEIDEDSDIAGTQVRVNDIITHVGGEPLNKADVLLTVIEKGKVGDVLELTIARVNAADYSVESFTVKVKLVEDKGSSTAPAEEETQPWWSNEDPYGGFPWDW
ncbi:MAG: trypsin-like peptidase domain-containing protein [Oscillospiraceae bacterium]|nr:trypsin-like peptidase domain-containing protein [Oscillospiraceae bacterium]